MNLRVHLACFALFAAGGCATPGQYVYNCTQFPVTVDSKAIAARTFEARSVAPTLPGRAVYPDGSVHSPVQVKSSEVDSFGYSNAWISPANVCRQFDSDVVIVDLR